MTIKVIKKNRLDVFLYYILGLSCSTDIFYLIKFNSFELGFTPVVALIIVTRFMMLNRKVNVGDKLINRILVFYFILCVFSSILILLQGFSGYFDIFLKNIVVLLFGFIIYFSVILGKDYKSNILSGIILGLFLNAFYITYQVTFSHMITVPLITIPEDFILGGHSTAIASNLYYHGRGFGFFAEPSHAAVFFNTMLILCFYKFSGIKRRVIYLLISGSYILTMSSAIPLLFIAWVTLPLFVMYNKKFKGIQKRNLVSNLIGISLISLFVFIVYILLQFLNMDIVKSNELGTKFYSLLAAASLGAENNSARLITMQAAGEIFKNYPFGIGYGLGPQVVGDMIGETRLHSRTLTLMVEIGFHGLMFILVCGILIIKNLIRCRTYEAASISIALVVYAINLTLGSGIPFDFFWIILGLASVVSRERITRKIT